LWLTVIRFERSRSVQDRNTNGEDVKITEAQNCVGEAKEWKAQAGFNVLFRNPTPVGVDFIGIIFYKQGANGKDVEFMNEYQQNIGEKNRYYATTDGEIFLPAGTYSVYIIALGQARSHGTPRQPDRIFREDGFDGEVEQTCDPSR